MPNYCFNKVNMRGIGSNKDFYTTSEKGNEEFDFQKIIECPDELYKSTASGYAYDLDLREVIITALENLIHNDMHSFISSDYICSKAPLIAKEREAIEEVYKKYKVDRQRVLETGLNKFQLLVKYGFVSWYEFCTNIWGTKWNAWDTFIVDEDNVEFITAWNPPYGIFMELSKMYPYDLITVNWSEEGGVSGFMQFHSGECICDKEYVYNVSSCEELDSCVENRLFTPIVPLSSGEENENK